MASYPSPDEIVSLADELGYKEKRSQVSATIFLIQIQPDEVGQKPTQIHVYYTTQSIMTLLDHPTQGYNRLYRSHAYENLDDLRELFTNPRLHTEKGYRRADDAVRVCVVCNQLLPRKKFSMNQWRTKGPLKNVCKDCVAQKLQTQEESDGPAILTEDNLKLHDQTAKKKKSKQPSNKTIHDRLVRRQFNCPDCPNEGRGTYVFFKKVPATKPIVKCPQCKKVKYGRCNRLYPVPVAKGYGLFKCHVCSDTWGSSRAVDNVGQQCFTCQTQGSTTLVKPFRMETCNKKKKGRRMRRPPPEPIAEEESGNAAPMGYTERDRVRNETGGGNALLRGGGDHFDGSSYGDEESYSDLGSRSSDTTSSSEWQLVAPRSRTQIPEGYQHQCAACKTGSCRNRRVGFSTVHDVSDGNTVSTSASLMTNSSIDKSDYIDRDEDCSGFEDDWTPEE